jgi:hypothetical protein
MKRPSEKKAAKKPQTIDDLLDAIVPKRAVEKTAVMLEKHKATTAKNDPRTRAVHARDFGFPGKVLTIFVRPEATNDEIVEKFAARFGREPGSDFRIRQNKRVPKATK